MEPWSHGTMEPWNGGAMERWSHGTVEPWSHGTMEPWNRGIVEPWNHTLTGRYESGDVLRAVSQAIWPTQDVSPDAMYCFDEEIHGSVSVTERKKYANILDGFRHSIDVAINITERSPRDPSLGRALQTIQNNASFFSETFLQVGRQHRDETHQWKQKLENVCYVMAKYSYWFLRYMPKKMADNIVFDSQKFGNNQLGLVNQINAKRLRFPPAALSPHVTDLNDRYEELYIHIGEPISLQFQASNAENGKFCGSNFCTAMWLSTAGYRDYIYYRQCLGDNPLEVPSEQCPADQWTICTKASGCTPSIVLTNDYFPLALRSAATGMCADCSSTGTWCKIGMCPAYVHNSGPTRDPNDDQQCSDAPEHCKGPQFQIHNFERGVNEPLEIFDEVHFSYASKAGVQPKFLSGDLYSGAFLRTQYYMRLEDKFSVNSKKTGATSGPYSCPTGKTWGLMNVDERAACAQSSFTLFKKIDPKTITALAVPSRRTSSRYEEDEEGGDFRRRPSGESDREMQRAGGPRVLTGDDEP
ncbi:hypothetical protein BV898_04802 [Hypsibius exemplaris]|uniref:Uncharacterized protein n=1 Tax=Hypsibius exemplaris TaxID=2072580 RepID=A0A1W0X1J6_HYPEX|nr:hypothetical protein BV898_04802 [Hypsibius exemplaris]